jgi:phosphoserine aminotransferase
MMNIPFNLANTELIETFLELAKKEGLANLKGHRLGGGVRASIYNAMPESAVDQLIDFMKEFMRVHG